MVRLEAEWHSVPLEVLYQSLGWFAFAAWSCSFYPQVILNFRRKSVIGLNIDFVLLNLTKHSSYLIYNASLYFSPTVQLQYYEKYGFSELIPVAPSDVAFSIHAVILTAFTAYQVCVYDRGGQKASILAKTITIGAWTAAGVCLVIAWPRGRWLWLVSEFNIIQVVMTFIKYIPQAWMNFQRKSTIGWSIQNILLDLSGGLGNFLQMGVQSIDQEISKQQSDIGSFLHDRALVSITQAPQIICQAISENYYCHWRSLHLICCSLYNIIFCIVRAKFQTLHTILYLQKMSKRRIKNFAKSRMFKYVSPRNAASIIDRLMKVCVASEN